MEKKDLSQLNLKFLTPSADLECECLLCFLLGVELFFYMQNLSVLHLILVNVPYCSLVVLVSNGNGNGSRVVVRVADMAVVLLLLFGRVFFCFNLC